MDRPPFTTASLIPALIGAAVTAAVAIGGAAVSTTNHANERIATLEQVSRTTDARLTRIETKLDELIARR